MRPLAFARGGATAAVLGLLLPQAAAAREPGFLEADRVNAIVILPSPPALGSAENSAELGLLHRLQETRTPEQIAQAQADDGEQDIFIFKSVLGTGFTPEALPLIAALSLRVHNDESPIAGPGKKYWHRSRPFNVDQGLHPVCRQTKDLSYPSGHAVSGYAEALVLVAMVPEKRDAVLARADDYAHNRLICGVHYPSDLEASKLLAYAMNALVMNDPQFRQQFEPAKAELRHALGLE